MPVPAEGSGSIGRMSSPAGTGIRSLAVDIDGPVHYVDMGGPAGGPLMVAVHGLGGSHINWSAVAPRLTQRSRLLALDLVGHGLTPVEGRTPDIEGHRRLLSGFLQAVVGSPAILIGNSMGGLVSALQAVAEPETVAGLVLVDPALPTARPGLVHPRVVVNFALCAVPGVGEHFLAHRRRLTTAEESVQRVLGVCCVDRSRVPADVVAAHVALTEQIDRARGDAAYLQSARSLSHLLARPAATIRRLGGLDQPVLLLQGGRDVLIPLSAARRMSAAHPDWRFEVAPDIGHVPMLEAPEWTCDMIEDWLDHQGSAAAVLASPSVTSSPTENTEGGPRGQPQLTWRVS
jgi:pimeloyl-ACP methyl ester carboxylesterase